MRPLVALVIFGLAFFSIATEKADKVKVVLIGAGAMLVLGLAPGAEVFYSEHAGIDWNVIFLLLGMMIVIGIVKQTGVFDYLGIWAAKRSRGEPYRLLVMLMLITAVASPFLDNVTTIMLVAPVTIVVCERLRIPPQPYLIAEVLASNIGGAATLIGDPPNIIIGSRAGLSFNDFLVHMTPIVVIVFALFVVLSRFLFRKDLRHNPEQVAAVLALQERRAIKDPRLLVRCLVVLAVMIAGFSLHSVVHLEPSLVALIGAGVMILVAKADVAEVLREVEWATLVFFMGLFVMVGGLVQTGAIDHLSHWLADATGGSTSTTAYGLLGGSAVLSALVDNIPYVATMSPVVASLVPGPGPHVFWWALALGADLGGNATAIGASANVVMLGIAERAGHRITFWEFTKYGLVVTVVTVALCAPYLALRYL